MKDLPLGFMYEVTELTTRLVGELALDYGLEATPENAHKIGMLLVNTGITMAALSPAASNETLKKDIGALIDSLDVKKVQEIFAVVTKIKRDAAEKTAISENVFHKDTKKNVN